MKKLVENIDKNSSEQTIINQIEKQNDGYHTDQGGREFYYQADGNHLNQIFCDDEDGDDTIYWSVASVEWNGIADKFEVQLSC